jgi:hypothetical protein
MTGGLDSGSTPEMSRALAAEAADGEALVLEGLAHLAPIEGAERCAEHLTKFLAERCR